MITVFKLFNVITWIHFYIVDTEFPLKRSLSHSKAAEAEAGPDSKVRWPPPWQSIHIVQQENAVLVEEEEGGSLLTGDL